MSPPPIRTFIVDEQAIFRECVVAILEQEKDLRVAGHTGTATEAKALIAKTKPDILLLDVNLPLQNALELLRDMPDLSPKCKTIAMAAVAAEGDVVEVMRLGARGFLVKDAPTRLFVKCVRKVHAGEVWLNGKMTDSVLTALSTGSGETEDNGKGDLSRRELEVIQLVIQGYKNRDIANKLFISEKTVKNHLSAIFNKLGVTDRLELTLYVFEKKFFPVAAD